MQRIAWINIEHFDYRARDIVQYSKEEKKKKKRIRVRWKPEDNLLEWQWKELFNAITRKQIEAYAEDIVHVLFWGLSIRMIIRVIRSSWSFFFSLIVSMTKTMNREKEMSFELVTSLVAVWRKSDRHFMPLKKIRFNYHDIHQIFSGFFSSRTKDSIIKKPHSTTHR